MESYAATDLLNAMWEQVANPKEDQQLLSSALCRLAMTLYIDNEPLNRTDKPTYCRLFADVPLQVKKQKESLVGGVLSFPGFGGAVAPSVKSPPSNENAAVTTVVNIQVGDIKRYQELLENLKGFLRVIAKQIDEEAMIFAP